MSNIVSELIKEKPEIKNQLVKLFQRKLDAEILDIDFERQSFTTEDGEYSFDILNVNDQNYINIYQKKDNIVYLVTREVITLNKDGKKKIKSNHGIVPASYKRAALAVWAMAILSYAYLEVQDRVQANEVQAVEDNEDTYSFEEEDVLKEYTIDPNWQPPVGYPEVVTVTPEVIELQAPVNQVNEINFAKREETHEVFGEIINKYATRYGLDWRLMEAMFTQERPNLSSKDSNIGQLTPSMIGGILKSPTFDSVGNYLGDEYAVILPSSYQGMTEEDFKKRANSGDNYIRMANEVLEKHGEVFFYNEVIKDVEKNIHMSLIFHGFLLNLKGNFWSMLASYNMGYPSVPNNLSFETMLRGSYGVGGHNYLYVVLNKLSEEEKAEGLTFYRRVIDEETGFGKIVAETFILNNPNINNKRGR